MTYTKKTFDLAKQIIDDPNISSVLVICYIQLLTTIPDKQFSEKELIELGEILQACYLKDEKFDIELACNVITTKNLKPQTFKDMGIWDIVIMLNPY
ncbi:hypothetical protein [Filifactor alocis]|uniref:hypothetical protein n=1 Tax=Filifactor alocis TaxID=143361 RepID=UPI003F9FDEB8